MRTSWSASISESLETQGYVAEGEGYEVLRLTGLLQKANIPAKNLTLVGRKQLEIARALATRPKVLLLDEAISGLNPTETETVMTLIRNIQGRGITVFMIEHIMKAVMGLSDRILVLNFGELIAQGTPEQVSKNKAVIEAYLGTEGSTGDIDVLKVEEISTHYGDIKVLWEASLAISPKEMVTMVGSNGSGKTTRSIPLRG